MHIFFKNIYFLEQGILMNIAKKMNWKIMQYVISNINNNYKKWRPAQQDIFESKLKLDWVIQQFKYWNDIGSNG